MTACLFLQASFMNLVIVMTFSEIAMVSLDEDAPEMSMSRISLDPSLEVKLF